MGDRSKGGSVPCLSAATRRDACLVARKAFFPVGATGKRAGATKFSFIEEFDDLEELATA